MGSMSDNWKHYPLWITSPEMTAVHDYKRQGVFEIGGGATSAAKPGHQTQVESTKTIKALHEVALEKLDPLSFIAFLTAVCFGMRRRDQLDHFLDYRRKGRSREEE
jgi:hypothetical protein